MRSRRERLVAGSLLLLAVLLLLGHAARLDLINDDAFISFRYADNLVRHGELTFNPGERVEGYTNFLWTLVLALVLRLGGDPVAWSKGLGLCFGVATLLTLFLASLRSSRPGRAGRSPLWAGVGPLLLALSPGFAAWSEGGLETALFTWLLTLGVFRCLAELEDGGPPWSAAVLALAAMTRPEGVLVFGVLAVFRIPAAIRGGGRTRRTEALLWGAVFVALWGTYWVWRTVYYGYPFPNTFYVKAGGGNWQAGLLYLGTWLRESWIWAGIPLALVVWTAGSRARRRAMILLFLTLAYGLHVTRAGGDFMALHRFFVPLYPGLAYLVQEGVYRLAGFSSRRRPGTPQPRLRAAGMAAVPVLAVALVLRGLSVERRTLVPGSRNGIDSVGLLKAYVAQWTVLGTYLRDVCPPDTRIAISPAGVIPFVTRFPTLDLYGLNDVHVAHHGDRVGGGKPGHTRMAPMRYIEEWKPDIILLHPSLGRRPLRPPPDQERVLRESGFRFRAVRVPGLNPPVWSFYERIDRPRVPGRR